MARPGVYTKEEKKMLEQWDIIEQEVGWVGDDPIPGKVAYPVVFREATRDAIRDWANGTQNLNPIYLEEKYARQTRWGSIIAPPFFQQTICPQGPVSYRIIPPEVGIGRTMDPGAPQQDYPVMWAVFPHWEHFKPIRPGDSFRIWCGPNIHIDETNSNGKGPRIFSLHDQVKYFNQKNELVTIRHKKVKFYIASRTEKNIEVPGIKPTPVTEKYKYTDEELNYINNIHDNEKIRGDQIRWWEDVIVGEDLQPIANGPSSVWEEVMHLAYLVHLHQAKKPDTIWEDVRETSGFGAKAIEGKQVTIPPHVPVKDPETGVWRNPVEGHLVDKINAKHDGKTQFATVCMNVWWCMMGRIVTNWMGDDGFLKKTTFDHLDVQIIGDTVIGKGKVIKKYVQDDGEHVVEIACWLENMRGYITNLGTATVGLFSRESIDKDLMRY
jgi:hypothetical protein